MGRFLITRKQKLINADPNRLDRLVLIVFAVAQVRRDRHFFEETEDCLKKQA